MAIKLKVLCWIYSKFYVYPVSNLISVFLNNGPVPTFVMSIIFDLMSPNILEDTSSGTENNKNFVTKFHHINIVVLQNVIQTYHIVTNKYAIFLLNVHILENIELILYDGPGFLSRKMKLSFNDKSNKNNKNKGGNIMADNKNMYGVYV